MADPSSVMREYRKGNWTVNETLVLIEAKKMEEERRMRRSTGLPPENRNRPSELRWKWIEEYCWKKGCMRNQNQCNDKWDNLMRDYKKIREYERWRVESSFNTVSSSSPATSPSYWKMEKSERKEKTLPSNMLPLIYEKLSELVEKKGLPSSAAVSAGNGSYSGGQIISVCKQSLGFLTPVIAQPLHQIPATTTTIVLPLPPPPRQQPLVLSQPPPFQPPPSTFHVEPIQPTVSVASSSSFDSDIIGYPETSPAKRRRTMPGETTGGEEITVGAALSRSASVIAQVIRESEERQEMRHREVVRMQERRLKIEESKAEINRQGMSGLVDAISKLATSICALASSSSSSSSSHNNQNHQGTMIITID